MKRELTGQRSACPSKPRVTHTPHQPTRHVLGPHQQRLSLTLPPLYLLPQPRNQPLSTPPPPTILSTSGAPHFPFNS